MSIDELIQSLGLSIDCQFVPFSQSRSSGDNQPSLNWKITLLRNGNKILTTDYMQGCGHCPASKIKDHYHRKEAIKLECETGKRVRVLGSCDIIMRGSAPVDHPNIADVLYCLVADADVLNYANFADWAVSLGFNSDSISDREVYQACLDIALPLRAAIGDENLSKLAESFANY